VIRKENLLEGSKGMLNLLFYLMFFPIIIAFKMIGWIVKGILGIFKIIGLADIFGKL